MISLWIPIAFVSYFLNALASVIDKGLLKTRIPDPLTYAFYTGITSIGIGSLFLINLVFPIINFDFSLPSLVNFLLAFSGGATLIIALYFFYIGVKEYDATRVVPLVFGVFTPILTLLISATFTGETLDRHEIIAFGLFLVGGLFLMGSLPAGSLSINVRLLSLSATAGVFYALSFVFTKVVLTSESNFLNGFFWLRMGSFFFALLILITPIRHKVTKQNQSLSGGSAGIFLINKIIGAFGLLALNFAILIGPVSLINSLKGTEYFFVFLLALLFTKFAPRVVSETFTARALAEKLIGILLIIGGLALLHGWGVYL